MRVSKELQVGKAGEYLVCADLIIKGFVAFPSEQGLPYDVVLDTGAKMLRIQVKTCEKPRELSFSQRKTKTIVYQYTIKFHGKHRDRLYDEDEVDIFALVALDSRLVGYVLAENMRSTVNFRVDALRGTYRDEKALNDYKRVRELKDKEPQLTQREISKKLGINYAMVNRCLGKNYKPFIKSANYFSDIIRTAEWFNSI